MVEVLLDVRNLTKRYGDFYALSDVTMQVEKGTVHGVIGPNGAGKTTFFHCIAGTSPSTCGEIVFERKNIEGLPQHARPGLGIGRSFQVNSLFPDLSVIENLRLASQALEPIHGFVFWRPVVHEDIDQRRAESVLHRLGLDGEEQTMVRALSHGQQRLLEVGMALMAQPHLILLDEPTSGMGVDDVPKMIELIKGLRGECTILLIEHNISLVSEVCDAVTVLQAGAVIAQGTPDQISQDEHVKSAYLGEEL